MYIVGGGVRREKTVSGRSLVTYELHKKKKKRKRQKSAEPRGARAHRVD